MAIEMNFGWLNDYTGSKFAPVTLANLVLLDTSSGSTETLFDFIESENKIMKESIKDIIQEGIYLLFINLSINFNILW